MSTYSARLHREPDGAWVASAVALPNCWSRGATREEALTKLAAEIRYRIEYCPCSGVADDYVQVEVQGERAPAARPAASQPAEAPGSALPVWASRRPAEPASFRGIAGCPAPRPPAVEAPQAGPTARPSGPETPATDRPARPSGPEAPPARTAWTSGSEAPRVGRPAPSSGAASPGTPGAPGRSLPAPPPAPRGRGWKRWDD